MKKLIILSSILLTLGFTSCTENTRAKQFGGDMTINVPKGNKVTNITWKGDELWYSYRPFQDGEKATTQSFVEESSWGLWKGTVTFKESKNERNIHKW